MAKFNLTNLKNIYLEALNRDDPTLVFEVIQGRGKFVFMMFFSDEDEESKDRLFVYLRNMQVFIKLKIYGSHRNGDFSIYFKKKDKTAIINELQLGNDGQAFSFMRFLENLNQQIPEKLSLQIKLNKIREIYPKVKSYLCNVIDEANKTNLMGVKKLPESNRPRDKTLRKLYIYTNGDAEAITELIKALKQNNYTLAWTDRDVKNKNFVEIMEQINKK